jgi:hypothetical protein
MKKLIAVSILLTVLTVSVFAQLAVSLDADIYPELITATAPLDDNADKDEAKAAYKGQGSFDFFSKWNTWKGNELRLSLKYTDPDGNYSGYIRFRGDEFIKPSTNTTPATTFNAKGYGNGGNLTFNEFLNRAQIDEYAIKGKIGRITGYFGNEADRGVTKAARYENFSKFMDGIKVDNFGILKPTSEDQTSPNGTSYQDVFVEAKDVNNLRKRAEDQEVTYVSVGVDLKPIYVTVTGGVAEINNINNIKNTATYTQGNAGLRVSGVGLLDNKITFDATYKITGGDPNSNTNDGLHTANGYEPGGEGGWEHAFGVYANLNLVEGLGLSVGYSGIATAKEDLKDGSETIKYFDPYYNGIDLRANYTGVDNLTLTFNNNFSFSAITGDKATSKSIKGISGRGLGDKESEAYFAMYNGLVASYKITDLFSARGEIGNRLIDFTYTNDSKVTEAVGDRFRVVASGVYTLNTHVGFEAGLAFDINHRTFKPQGTGDIKTGKFTFGVPLRLHVVY